MREYEYMCDLGIKQQSQFKKHVLKIIKHHITRKLA